MPQLPIETTNHGMAIRGTAYLPEGVRRHPAVLLLHGFTGNRIETGFIFVQLGRALAAAGIAAVTFDFRHSGESDGSFDQMLVSGELDDALRMTHWLQGQPFADRSRLGLLGFSLGGLLAACLMSRTDAYRALALLAPTTPANLARHAQGEGIVGPYKLHPRFGPDLLAHQPLEQVIAHPRPTLLVQGSADTAVPPAVAEDFTRAMRRADVPLDLCLIDGAGHAFNTPAHRATLLRAVTDHFTTHLITHPA